MSMARRRTYTGHYSHSRHPPFQQTSQTSELRDTQKLYKMMMQCLGAVYSAINVNYLALATVFVIVLLSYLIPDVSQKIHANNELKDVKKVVNTITTEINRAEAACLSATDELCRLRCSVLDSTTETEITIMSYVYTDSFNGQASDASNSTFSDW
ncbi:uncharacterized protein LOC101745544 isoform X2 [Bombyx mori]|uniref:Uncharacterized protein n=1 Tax=Bombyx mori TaxID=7091 RepID=A0A8R2QZS8_BOMMO|nr:uncharacterized protein LOC101745544 isoform X2 [Bombyx mori]